MRFQLSELRQRLHAAAEHSGEERHTAAILIEVLEQFGADALIPNLGGHGLAAVFNGAQPGPSVLLRSDMDALPTHVLSPAEGADEPPRAEHRCGHDGHMTTLIGAAEEIVRRGLRRGQVILLFQPAEETGQGAHLVLDDPKFQELRPEYAIAQHNLPGYPLGTVVLRDGVFASASRGMIIALAGKSSHASEPHLGHSPVPAAAYLAQGLQALPQNESSLDETAQVTVVGLEVGGPHFGTSPENGRVMATLRSHSDEVLARLAARAEALAQGIAGCHGLDHQVSWVDDFPTTINDESIVARVSAAADKTGLNVVRAQKPFAWSEDFGHFTAATPGALFGLGSGVEQPALHTPDYEFPDSLLEPGRRLFVSILVELLGPDALGPAE